MSQRNRRRAAATAAGALLTCLLAAAPVVSAAGPPPPVPLGAFLGSDARGVRRMTALRQWLGGTDVRVGHTYLPGNNWSDIEGDPVFLWPWAVWRHGAPGRLFVLNVPMSVPNNAVSSHQ